MMWAEIANEIFRGAAAFLLMLAVIATVCGRRGTGPDDASAMMADAVALVAGLVAVTAAVCGMVL